MITENEKQALRFIAREEYYRTIGSVRADEVVNAAIEKYQCQVKEIEALK